MAEFERLDKRDLGRLDSEELVAYVRTAVRAQDSVAVEDAFGVLVYRHEGDVRNRVRIKVPEPDVEDVAQEALLSAFRLVLSDTEVRSFTAVLGTIVKRRIADYTKRAAARPTTSPLPGEHEGDPEIWGAIPHEMDESGAIATQEIVERVYERLSKPHRAVVDAYVFGDMPAQDTADEVNRRLTGDSELRTPMTAQNVHQIATRFRAAVRAELGEAEG